MKKFEFTWETKADVMGDTRADVRAEVSFWKVEKISISDILLKYTYFLYFFASCFVYQFGVIALLHLVTYQS